MFISNVSLCVGVGRDRYLKLAHLVELERPQCVFTFPWQTGEHFETGRWYRQVPLEEKQSFKTKTCWKMIDEIIPTNLIRGGEKLTLIDVSLPMFFSQDLDLFSSIKLKYTSDVTQKPICPLFGQENSIKILDLPVDGFVDKNGNLPTPGTLYCVRVQISFTPGFVPIWSYNRHCAGVLDSFQWPSTFGSQTEDSTEFHPYFRSGNSSSHRKNYGSSAKNTWTNNTFNNRNTKSIESLPNKTRKTFINEENLKYMEEKRLEKMRGIFDNKEKSRNDEIKSLNNIKTYKPVSNNGSSIFWNGNRHKLQQENLGSRSVTTSRSKSKECLVKHVFDEQQKFKPNLMQNNKEDIYQNKQPEKFNKNIQQNNYYNKYQNMQQNIFENIQQNNNYEKHQNISFNKHYDVLYKMYKNNQLDDVYLNEQQNKHQPKPVNKCFVVQKTLNVENIKSSSTISSNSSTLKIDETNESDNLFNKSLTNNNSSTISESSYKDCIKQKQQLPFSVAAKFSSLNISDENKVIKEEEPGGFGYSRRCRFGTSIKTNQQQSFGQQQKTENPFQTFQFKSNNNFEKDNGFENFVGKNKNEENVDEDEDFEIDQALNASLSDDEKNEYDEVEYEDSEVLYYPEESDEEHNVEKTEDYDDYTCTFAGSQTVKKPSLFSSYDKIIAHEAKQYKGK